MEKEMIGKKVTNFQLPNQDEEIVSLEQFAGKWVVVYFYPKDNTPGCTIEAKDFTSDVEEFNKKNAVILGISPDKAASHQRFIEKQNLSLQLLSDPEHEVMEYFSAWGMKKLYGREFMGVIRSTFLIDPDGNLAWQWPKVKVKGHVEEVLAKIEELQSN